MNLKKLDPTKGTFEAGGKIYHIEKQLSISRFHEYQIYELELGLSQSFKSIVESLKLAYQDMNSGKLADASVKLNNILMGITKVNEKEHAALKICALFMNTADEDRTTINEDMISQKIEDWAEYDYQDFFTLALNTVSGFLTIYAEMRETISQASKTLNSKE